MAIPIGNGERIAEIKKQIAEIEASGEARYGCLSYYPKKGKLYPKFTPNRHDAAKSPHCCSKAKAKEYEAAIARGKAILELKKELKALGGDK